SQNAHVRCYRIQCPALPCPRPVTDPQQCCPRCLEPQPSSALGTARGTCSYKGSSYQPGETFSSRELLPGSQRQHCTQCHCTEGQISCGQVPCPELPCPSPRATPDPCCQPCTGVPSEEPTEEEGLRLPVGTRHCQDQCSGEAVGTQPSGARSSPALPSSLEDIARSLSPKAGGGTTVRIVLREKHKKACLYQGQTYSHGDVWHPALRRHGLLPCVLCTCRDGIQHCQRLSCPTEYPCAHPRALPGKCCKVCPASAKPTDAAAPSSCCTKPPHRALMSLLVPPSSEASPEVLRTVAEEEAAEGMGSWHLPKG
ncbi:CRDL2 protein, partial [Ramphastos sulfuratus]|nr:CRDL2 protein [Ramphastos sulfuratus]